MAETGKVSKKKVPDMKDLLNSISKLISVDDKFMLEFLQVDSSELECDDEESECSSEARTFALNLFYFAPKAYEYVITKYDTCLPPVSILRTWFVHEGGVPGFTEESLDAIGEKANQSENKICCCLIIRDYDEYHAEEEYVDGEGYYGQHDVGTEMDLDCNERAITALVMSVAAITAPWSLPIGYFLLRGDSSDKIARLVSTAIFLLEQKGVVVTALSLEWGSYKNVPVALGCKVPKDTRNLKLVKFLSESHKDVIVVPDIRTWLTTILSVWVATKEFKDSTGFSIAWKYVEQLESASKTGQSTKRKKTEPRWFDLNDETVTSRVIEILKHKDVLTHNIPGAKDTIKFLTFVDDLLDIFNFKPFKNNPDQQLTVNVDNKATVIEKLEFICDYFGGIKQPRIPVANFTEFCIAAKGVIEIMRLYLDDGSSVNISLGQTTTQPVKEIFAKIKCGSGTQKGRDVSARRFKIGYNKTVKALLADF